MSRRFSVLALLALAMIPGCGGDDPPSDEEQIVATVNAWTDATATGDGEAACALMTDAGQEAMTDPYDGIGPDRPPVAETCEEAVPVLAERGENTDPDEMPDVVPGDVTVRGDKAVVQPDGGFCTYVQRTGDEWLIPYLPLPGPDDPDASGEIPPCEPDF